MYYTSFRTKPEEKGKDTFYPKEQFVELLEDSGNLFAQVPIETIANGIFLPPNSTISLENDGLFIDNPFCNLNFTIEESGSVWSGKPGDNVAHAELLEDGSHKHESRYFNINISVTYKGPRAKNKLMPEYKTWVENLAYDTKKWFSASNVEQKL